MPGLDDARIRNRIVPLSAVDRVEETLGALSFRQKCRYLVPIVGFGRAFDVTQAQRFPIAQDGVTVQVGVRIVPAIKRDQNRRTCRVQDVKHGHQRRGKGGLAAPRRSGHRDNFSPVGPATVEHAPGQRLIEPGYLFAVKLQWFAGLVQEEGDKAQGFPEVLFHYLLFFATIFTNYSLPSDCVNPYLGHLLQAHCLRPYNGRIDLLRLQSKKRDTWPFRTCWNPGITAIPAFSTLMMCDTVRRIAPSAAGLPDGRVQFRLVTEHGFAEATLVYNDGTAQGAPLDLYARDSRFLYWETILRPANVLVTYSFALKTATGQTVYFCKHGVDHAVEPLDRWVLDLTAVRPFEVPAWMNGAVVYQIFPDRFANGDRTNDPPGTVPWGSPPVWLEFQGGDLQGIIAALDYLQALGVDVLYLTPIFVSPSTHKYDTEDFYHVDPGFGGDQALHDLVAALHGRGMRLILDASFNHCNPRFFAFQDLLKNGADSPYRDWFTIHEYPVKIRYRPHLLQEERRRQYEHWLESLPRTSGIPFEQVEDEGALFEPSYLAWYGVLDMPKLNQRNPATRAYFLDVAAYWLREFDIDGWRMDVARHVEPDFWVDFRRVCKAAKPDCYLLAEIWGNTAPWLQGDQFDATMNYIFRDLCVAYFARTEMDTATFLDGITRMLKHIRAAGDQRQLQPAVQP